MNNGGEKKVGAVIVAAGSSRRMDGIDKVFSKLGDKPVIIHVLDTFMKCTDIDQIVVVLNEQNLEQGRQLITEQNYTRNIASCPGGERRQDSVIAGLNQLDNCGWVVIHDGARPLVTEDLIVQGLKEAQETGSAIAAIPVTDTIKVAGEDQIVQGTPPRHSLWAAQTPQVFRFDIINQAYQQLKYKVTDDARAVEQAGRQVKIYMGSYDNIKITTRDDLELAEILLRKRND
jgi:2-C-methyl-D-erythritol 4-phosphate cytidylyltransferase